MEDLIETDDYGKVEVSKHRIITELPKVVFFNLKRYRYRKDRNRLVKILADFEYPASINLGFLQGTPTGLEEDYVLFGVAVHRGQAYNSGHYFSFVNTSPDPDRPHWIKFNDSVVQLSSTETALSFTGGKKKVINWSREN
jgi:ubiquitin C-terminal hydrolase